MNEFSSEQVEVLLDALNYQHVEMRNNDRFQLITASLAQSSESKRDEKPIIIRPTELPAPRKRTSQLSLSQTALIALLMIALGFGLAVWMVSAGRLGVG